VKTKKVESPDVAMGIHPGLHAEGVYEYWEPTLLLLLRKMPDFSKPIEIRHLKQRRSFTVGAANRCRFGDGF
jgi:hypothetical protein